jgi:very-short-patch-repair endonuclease
MWGLLPRDLGRLIVKAGLPRPQRNARVHGHECDVLWPDAGLGLELDGFDGHGNRLAFERDRRRELHLRARGVEVIRVTWWQLQDEREALVATLARATASADPRALRARA